MHTLIWQRMQRSTSDDLLTMPRTPDRRRSVTPCGSLHADWTYNVIRHMTEDDQHWQRSGRKGFLGSPFDAVDILLRLCRGPCDYAKEDVTTCGCQSEKGDAVPCRVTTFEILAKMLEDAPDLADKCYPKSLHEFLEQYRQAAPHMSQPQKVGWVRSIFRRLMIHAPDDAYFDPDTAVLGQLKRSTVFELVSTPAQLAMFVTATLNNFLGFLISAAATQSVTCQTFQPSCSLFRSYPHVNVLI